MSLRAAGSIDLPLLREALLAAGVRESPAIGLTVIAATEYLHPELEEWNRASLEREEAWLLVRPVEPELWIGPLFVPWETPCWACLAERLRQREALAAGLPTRRAATLASEIVAAELSRGGLTEPPGLLAGRVLSFDTSTWRTRLHTLVALPHCSVCGAGVDPEEAEPTPIRLSPPRPPAIPGAGARSTPPELTQARLEHHVSAITGIVAELEPCYVPVSGMVHVYRAGHNFARDEDAEGASTQRLRQHSSGKGVTDLEARVSGLCEALERYSGVYRGCEPRRHRTQRELGPAALDPNGCMLFSDTQFADRDAWNRTQPRHLRVPHPLDPDARLDWSPLWSLTHQELRYLPAELCYFRHPTPPEHSYSVSCSNGNAAGNTLAEAILHGFLELVERDAVSLWWYNRARRPAVDPASFAEPYLDRVAAFLSRFEREIWLLDLTTDFPVPCFVAVSRRVRGPEQVMLGFGAHLQAPVAALRAVTELVQLLQPVLETDARADPQLQYWLRTASTERHPYLLPDPSLAPRGAADFPAAVVQDPEAGVHQCRQWVEERGMEMLVLDLTRAEVGLPVARVVVPGMRSLRPRFAPGRLYDVPARLGWVSQPLAEAQLNPTPLFY